MKYLIIFFLLLSTICYVLPDQVLSLTIKLIAFVVRILNIINKVHDGMFLLDLLMFWTLL